MKKGLTSYACDRTRLYSSGTRGSYGIRISSESAAEGLLLWRLGSSNLLGMLLTCPSGVATEDADVKQYIAEENGQNSPMRSLAEIPNLVEDIVNAFTPWVSKNPCWNVVNRPISGEKLEISELRR